ncbi:4Fe-4S binding protein [Vulcanisaeta souniana]|uniref:4Fe-4S binding protein n=1 Tax=Vulcanisaeta souniana TaxID=164452 RepID=UPI000A51F04F|nr:4Fe-4S binding protein [Vulcanisaeta souniana]
MMIGAAIPGLKPNQRNPYFTGGTAKHYRPVINFDKCIKCSLCWEYCPDSVFDVTPDATSTQP